MRLVIVLLFGCSCSGCIPLLVGYAIDRHANNAETKEDHRHYEEMKKIQLMEKQMKMEQERLQAPQRQGSYVEISPPAYVVDAGIVRENPFGY